MNYEEVVKLLKSIDNRLANIERHTYTTEAASWNVDTGIDTGTIEDLLGRILVKLEGE